jgi:hypothetical protein
MYSCTDSEDECENTERYTLIDDDDDDEQEEVEEDEEDDNY